MHQHNGKWQSSFVDLDDPTGEITPEQAVLTVLSGSQGNGGYVSMFLETVEPSQTFSLKTILTDLTTADQVHPAITTCNAQIVNTSGAMIKQNLPKGGDPNALNQSHHVSYTISTMQGVAVLAVERMDVIPTTTKAVSRPVWQLAPARGGSIARTS